MVVQSFDLTLCPADQHSEYYIGGRGATVQLLGSVRAI